MRPTNILTWGFLSGSGICLWILITFVLKLQVVGMEFVSVGILAAGIFIGLWRKRKKELYGSLSFWRGLKNGIGLAFLAALVVSVFFGFYSGVDPQSNELGLAMEKARLLDSGLSQEEVARELDKIRLEASAGNQVFLAFFGTFGQGVLLAFLAALALRKKVG